MYRQRSRKTEEAKREKEQKIKGPTKLQALTIPALTIKSVLLPLTIINHFNYKLN